jgi:hypothetical protein
LESTAGQLLYPDKLKEDVRAREIEAMFNKEKVGGPRFRPTDNLIFGIPDY